MAAVMTEHSVTFTLNGEPREARVDPRIHLGDFLRHSLGLTGTHLGCEHGVCGACTVIVNGAPVRSCLMLAIQIDGTVVETVESLGKLGALSPLQQAFATNHGLQCGFSHPGNADDTRSLLAHHARADRAGGQDRDLGQHLPLYRL